MGGKLCANVTDNRDDFSTISHDAADWPSMGHEQKTHCISRCSVGDSIKATPAVGLLFGLLNPAANW